MRNFDNLQFFILLVSDYTCVKDQTPQHILTITELIALFDFHILLTCIKNCPYFLCISPQWPCLICQCQTFILSHKYCFNFCLPLISPTVCYCAKSFYIPLTCYWKREFIVFNYPIVRIVQLPVQSSLKLMSFNIKQLAHCTFIYFHYSGFITVS